MNNLIGNIWRWRVSLFTNNSNSNLLRFPPRTEFENHRWTSSCISLEGTSKVLSIYFILRHLTCYSELNYQPRGWIKKTKKLWTQNSAKFIVATNASWIALIVSKNMHFLNQKRKKTMFLPKMMSILLSQYLQIPISWSFTALLSLLRKVAL